MNNPDIRWQQRFDSYQRALEQLVDAVSLSRQRPLSRLEQQGLIKAFECTHELAWNVLKDYFEYQGNTGITGSRDAILEAFRHGLVEDTDAWMSTIVSRFRSFSAYDQEILDQLVDVVADSYLSLFRSLAERMRALA